MERAVCESGPLGFVKVEGGWNAALSPRGLGYGGGV